MIDDQEVHNRFSKALDEQRRKQQNKGHEAAEGGSTTASEPARLEREAITQALVKLRIFTLTWTSIPLPSNAREAAKDS